MATELVADVLGISQLTPGPAHTGKDGGSDAWYAGAIDGVPGPWKIACAVRSSFGALKRKAVEEHASGVAQQAEAILLCTPLDLNVGQTQEIERILGAGLKAGKCWPRSKLDYYLRQSPWVAALHFGVPLLPGFVPLRSATELAIANQPDRPLLGRTDALHAATAFLTSSDRVLLVIAPGGTGKSRFVRALDGLAAPGSAARSAWLRQPRQGTIEDAILRGLPRNRPLLLCMDDAGLDLDEALGLARLSQPRHDSLDVKVVLAARLPDQFLLEQRCQQANAPYRVLHLDALGSESATTLALEECPDLSAEGITALLRFARGNLFLLRAAAQLIAAGTSPSRLIKQAYLRGVLVTKLVHEAVQLLAPLGVAKADTTQLLLQTALDAPVPADVLYKDRRLATLFDGKVLRVVGNGLRFRADVEGDLLLGELTRVPWAQTSVRHMMEAQPDRMAARMRNLAAAGEGYPAEIIRQACAAWIATAATTTEHARLRNLRILPHAAGVAPREVVAVCQQYLSIPAAPPTDRLERAFAIGPPSTDDLGPVILALAHNGQPVEAIRLARTLFNAGVREGRFANYKPQSLGEDLVSPAHASPDHVHALLLEIEQWAAQSGVGLPTELIQSVLAAVLSGIFGRERFTATHFHWGEIPFVDTPAVRRVREHALTLLQELVGHGDPTLRLAACEVVRTIGRGGYQRAIDDSLTPIVEREVATMIARLAQQLNQEDDLAIMYEIEDGLLTRWAAEGIGADAVVEVLRGRAWPPLYRAYQLVYHVDDWMSSTDDVFAIAPATDRWHWWVERRRHSLDQNQLTALAETLRDTYANADAMLQALRPLAKGRLLFALLDAWCPRSRDLFIQLQSRADCPPELRHEITRALRRLTFQNAADRAIADLNAILATATDIDIKGFVDDSVLLPASERLQIARALVADERIAIRAHGLRGAFPRADFPLADRIALLTDALRDGNWLNHWDVVWMELEHPDVLETLPTSPLRVRLVARSVEALVQLSGDWGGNRTWYLGEIVSKVCNTARERLELVEFALAGDAKVRDLGELLAPLATSDSDLPVLARTMSRWLANGWVSGSQGVSDLLVTAFTEEENSLPPSALTLARSLLASSDIHDKSVGIGLLSELRDDPEACVDVVEACSGSDVPLAEVAEQVVWNFCRPRGSYGIPVGEVPPALQAIASMLARAQEQCRTLAACTLLQTMRGRVDDDITRHARHDDELLDPRH